jgi:hypothetical protein
MYFVATDWLKGMTSETSLFTVICGVMLNESQGQLYITLSVGTQYT